MTCKNCVHYEACLDWCRGFEEEPAKCEHFKDKSKFIELLSADDRVSRCPGRDTCRWGHKGLIDYMNQYVEQEDLKHG